MEQEKKKNTKLKIIIPVIIVIIVITGIFIKTVLNNKNVNIPIISKEEFQQYITEIPITIENYKDYITIEGKTVENKNAFGEITSVSKQPIIKLKDNVYGYVILEVNINKSILTPPFNRGDEPTQIITINSSSTNIYIPGLKEDVIPTFNDIECIKAKGNLYILNLPEDKWQIEEKNGKKYFNLENRNDNYYSIYWEDSYIDDLCTKEYWKYEEEIK